LKGKLETSREAEKKNAKNTFNLLKILKRKNNLQQALLHVFSPPPNYSTQDIFVTT